MLRFLLPLLLCMPLSGQVSRLSNFYQKGVVGRLDITAEGTSIDINVRTFAEVKRVFIVFGVVPENIPMPMFDGAHLRVGGIFYRHEMQDIHAPIHMSWYPNSFLYVQAIFQMEDGSFRLSDGFHVKTG